MCHTDKLENYSWSTPKKSIAIGVVKDIQTITGIKQTVYMVQKTL